MKKGRFEDRSSRESTGPTGLPRIPGTSGFFMIFTYNCSILNQEEEGEHVESDVYRQKCCGQH